MFNVYGDDQTECEQSSASPLDSFKVFDRDEAKAFRVIDRDEEDRLVTHFHKTRDTSTLKRLLDIRDQTIRYMAEKYAYLDNKDDMYSEFKGVWLRCVKKYDPSIRVRSMRTKAGKIILDDNGKVKTIAKKTPFNTYLYTSMKNRVWNIIKRRHSRKFCDENGDPVADTMRSLEYEYGEDGELTLKDIIPDTKSPSAFGRAQMSEMIKNLGGDDPDIARTISTFISNPRLNTLTAACNFRTGTLKITQWDRGVLVMGVSTEDGDPKLDKKTLANAHLKKMVMSTGLYPQQFEVIGYALKKGSVDFVVKIEDHKVLNKVKDAVMKCRELMSELHPEGCLAI
jgi:hypothetical protein